MARASDPLFILAERGLFSDAAEVQRKSTSTFPIRGIREIRGFSTQRVQLSERHGSANEFAEAHFGFRASDFLRISDFGPSDLPFSHSNRKPAS